MISLERGRENSADAEAHRRRADKEEARPSDVLIMRSKRDLRVTSERLTWTSSQLLTAILNAATIRGGFVTLMRDFITRPFLIVALMTRPILSGTLRPLFSLLYYRCAPDFPFFFYLDICAANPRFQ